MFCLERGIWWVLREMAFSCLLVNKRIWRNFKRIVTNSTEQNHIELKKITPNNYSIKKDFIFVRPNMGFGI